MHNAEAALKTARTNLGYCYIRAPYDGRVTRASYEAAANNFKLASLDAQDLVDESTAELAKNISEIEELNKKIRANLDREKAEIDAEEMCIRDRGIGIFCSLKHLSPKTVHFM